jgi:hypothetical protein
MLKINLDNSNEPHTLEIAEPEIKDLLGDLKVDQISLQ